MRDVGSSSQARQRVIERARRLFERRGLSGVTMDEIASGLGMSKKTLYQLFPSKEELGAAALEEAFAEVERELTASRERAKGDFGERLRAHLLIVAERYRRLEMSLLEDLERNSPALRARYDELSRGVVRRQFGALLSAGVQAGELRADIDAELVVRVMEVLSAGLLRAEALSALGMTAEQAFQAMFDIVLNGIRVRDRR